MNLRRRRPVPVLAQLEVAVRGAERPPAPLANGGWPLNLDALTTRIRDLEADLRHAHHVADMLEAKLAGLPVVATSGEELTSAHPVHRSCATAAGRVCDVCRPHLGYTHPRPGSTR